MASNENELIGSENETGDNYDLKMFVRKSISKSVREKKKLIEVKIKLRNEKLIEQIIDPIDEDYINNKFMKYCYKELIQDLTSIFESSFKEDMFSVIDNDYVNRLKEQSIYWEMLKEEKNLHNSRLETQFNEDLFRALTTVLYENRGHFETENKFFYFLYELKNFLCNYYSQFILKKSLLI
jgi:hypothetical protein